MPLSYLVTALLAAALLYFLFYLFRRHAGPTVDETPKPGAGAGPDPAAEPAPAAQSEGAGAIWEALATVSLRG
ncbi:hypothetical protein LLH00_01155 [bacterium]|nr:hypothetical protein [bacterium]